MKNLLFKKDSDVDEYIKWLVSNNLIHHLDDLIEDIVWCKELTKEDKKILQANDDALFEYCDIWQYFEEHDDIYKIYAPD